jgi:hypothetical protein
MLTSEMLQTLKAAILAETDAAVVAARTPATRDDRVIAAFYNQEAVPAFYVYRAQLSRHEILTGTSDEGTTFAWTAGAYITRSQGERDAFREMFNSTGNVDPSLPTIQSAFADIFSGTGGAGNRAHIKAMARRACNRFERIFATGTGSKAAPGVAAVSGSVSTDDVSRALNIE